MVLDRPVPRNADEILRGELQHEGHDADVGIERLQRRACLIAPERGELVHAHAPLLGGTPERISPRARLLGRAEDPRDLGAAREERLEHCLPEILLADDGNAHAGVLSRDRHSRGARDAARESDWLTAMLASDDGTVKGD